MSRKSNNKSIRKSKTGDDADDFEAWMRSRQLTKPDDQLELTEAELNEEISKVLTTKNPNWVRNLVVFSYKTYEYVLAPLDPDLVTLFNLDSATLLLDSPAARAQIRDFGEGAYIYPQEKSEPKKSAPKKKGIQMNLDEEGKERESKGRLSGDEDEGAEEGGEEHGEKPEDDADEDEEGEDEEKVEPDENEEPGEGDEGDGEKADETAEGETEAGEGEEGDEGAGGDTAEGDEAKSNEEEKPKEEVGGGDAQEEELLPARKKKLMNQFNFCERGALTFTASMRSVDTETIPPPRSKYGANVLQWILFDDYAEDFAKQEAEQEKEKKPIHGKKEKPKKIDKQKLMEELNKKYLKCWQILERMINQNIFDDIAQDYRFWEDPSDEFREKGEATLLPLWKFVYDKTKKMNVTALMFNPHYYDLFAVCYGITDFTKQLPEGVLCLFSIKNPSFPDYIVNVDSGVMCCDIHKKYPFLVAIGLYDGNAAVYNIQENTEKPIYFSEGVDAKHAECIQQLRFAPEMPDGEINFYTVSTDGTVFNWVLLQSRFCVTRIITLYLDRPLTAGPDGSEMRLRSCGSSMTFHPTMPEIYLVGTEDGYIYKCNTAFSSKFIMIYQAHTLSVYAIDFNKFNSNIFASCSGDWCVKIWEDMRRDPLFIFDLGTNVGDVKWAPYSSTVFAAVTIDGKVFVFDLNVNKYTPICVQAVVPRRKNKLTRIEFNTKLPFIIVSDDKGQVISLKLSPNCRVMCKPPKKQMWLDQHTMQVQKLEKLLSLVREVPNGDDTDDEPSTANS